MVLLASTNYLSTAASCHRFSRAHSDQSMTNEGALLDADPQPRGANDGPAFADNSRARPPPVRSRESPLLLRLADFDEVAIGVAHVTPRLGLVNLRFGEELRTQALPTFVALRNVRDADVHEAADGLAILRRCEVYGLSLIHI